MSNLGTFILMLAVAAIGGAAAFLGYHAGSVQFAIHMALILAASILFLIFIVRRSNA